MPSCAKCSMVRSCRRRAVDALQHLALGRRSTQQVQTNGVKCDVVDSKLRFNCVSTRPKAGQMVRLHLRLLQETRQCFARTFERCERTIRYCQMRGCRETITSTRGISDAPPDEWNPDGVNWLPAAHFVLNFRDPALPSPHGVLANATRATLSQDAFETSQQKFTILPSQTAPNICSSPPWWWPSSLLEPQE
jgi:hypothetical protein